MADAQASSAPRRSRSKANVRNGVTAIFVQEKETKNSVRFEEEVDNGKEPVIGMYFYIKKSLHERLGKPDALEISVKVAE